MRQKQRRRFSRQPIGMLMICVVLVLPFVLRWAGFMPQWSERTNAVLSFILVLGLLSLEIVEMRLKAKRGNP